MNKYIVSIDFGGTNIKMALVGAGGRPPCREASSPLQKKLSLPTSKFQTVPAMIDAIVNGSNQLICQSNIKRSSILGLGIGVAGLVNSHSGVIYSMTNVKGFEGVNLKKVLQAKLKVPVFLDNDTNLMALAELRKGAGKGAKNAVYLTLGTGVGGAVVIGGSLYRGSGLVAGEIGHMPINSTGPRCNCGGIACLESYIGNSIIASRAKKEILRRRYKGLIVTMVKGDLNKITPKILKKAADKKDKLAVKIWQDVAYDLAVCLVGIINMLNPDKIIIGGGVANAGRFLFGPLKKFAKARALSVPAKAVRIVKARFKENAGIIGAAEYVKEKISAYGGSAFGGNN